MTFRLSVATVMLAMAMYQPAAAATSPYLDFDLISVVPRSPSVKPQVMPITAGEMDTRLASKSVRPSKPGR